MIMWRDVYRKHSSCNEAVSYNTLNTLNYTHPPGTPEVKGRSMLQTGAPVIFRAEISNKPNVEYNKNYM